MKKLQQIPLVFALLLFSSQIFSQNVFPGTGNVGIGTSNPASPLHVRSGIQNEGLLFTNNRDNNWSKLLSGGTSAGAYNGITQAGDGGLFYGGSALGTGSGFVLAPWLVGSVGLRMSSTGLVTINTNAPLGSFNIVHNTGSWIKVHPGSLTAGAYNGFSQPNDAGIIFGGNSVGNSPGFVLGPWIGGSAGIRISGNGDVTAGKNLTVQGAILTSRVKVAALNSANWNWADYVFSRDYKLKSLAELETYIKTNKHLPNIPSASEVEKKGYDMAEMDSKLLEKIEELTLYLINIKKENELLKKRLQILEMKDK